MVKVITLFLVSAERWRSFWNKSG